MNLISIIIPVFNVSEYLDVCLTSLINQTYENMEILCVDDCSSDNSLNILEFYAQQDSRIKILKHEKNKGVGAARNTALKNISPESKYIFFMDSDDWLDLDSIKHMYEISKKNNIDFLIHKSLQYDNDQKIFFKQKYFEMQKINFLVNTTFDYHKIPKDFFFDMDVTVYTKFFSTHFLKSNHSKFSEGVIYEDNLFFYKNILNANKILFIDEYLYNRRQRVGSIIKSLDERVMDIFKVLNEILLYFIETKKYDEFKKYLLNYIFSTIIDKFNSINEKYKREYYKRMKRFFKKCYYNYKLKNDFEKFLRPYFISVLNLTLQYNNYHNFLKKWKKI